MKIKQLKKELGLMDKDIAKFFNISRMSYANSSAKKRYENALCAFYLRVKDSESKGKENE